MSSATSLTTTITPRSTKVRTPRHSRKAKVIPPSPLYAQKTTPSLNTMYTMESFRSIPSQQWGYTNEMIPCTINIPYSEMYQTQYPSVVPVMPNENLVSCSPVYQPITGETPYPMIQPTILQSDTPPLPYDAFNTYSPMVPIGYQSIVPNQLMSNYAMCDKMESGRIPVEKDKTVNSEIVELVHTNSSSLVAMVSPMTDLVPCISPCGEKPKGEMAKKEL